MKNSSQEIYFEKIKTILGFPFSEKNLFFSSFFFEFISQNKPSFTQSILRRKELEFARILLLAGKKLSVLALFRRFNVALLILVVFNKTRLLTIFFSIRIFFDNENLKENTMDFIKYLICLKSVYNLYKLCTKIRT